MPRTYLIFGDIEGKLDVLRVECTKCDRKGRYSVAKLIAKQVRSGNLMKWREKLNADCPKRDAHSLHERCDLFPICRRSYRAGTGFPVPFCALRDVGIVEPIGSFVASKTCEEAPPERVSGF